MSSSARAGGGAAEGDDDGPQIFRETVVVQVKPVGREAFQAALVVRLRPDDPSHPRSLLVELTDESDLLFYHSLVLGEGEFHALKAEQRLRVDFQNFPMQVAELLRRCCASAAAPGEQDSAEGAAAASAGCAALGSAGQAGSRGQSGAAGASEGGLRMLACLECGAGGDSIFSVVESNQFRELTHLALRLRQGSDEVVKRHLAGKLRASRSQASDLAARLASSEEALGAAQREAAELGARARVVVEERAHLERSLEAAHERELADLRREHARACDEQRRADAEARERSEAELRAEAAASAARAAEAERVGEALREEKESLTTSGRRCQERLEVAEAQLQEARQELQGLRSQCKELELLKYQHERQVGELQVQITGLQEQLHAKEQLVATQASQIEQSASQRRHLEEMLSGCKQHARNVEDKFALSTQEINKGNEIIRTLHEGNKQSKAKLKEKAAQLTQLERRIMELEQASELGRHKLEEKDGELGRAREREARLQEDAEELRGRLGEAHDVLKSNQEVIEYLNRQLTDRDLRAIPPLVPPRDGAGVSVGVGASSGAGGSAAASAQLAELLRRAEGAGRGLQGLAGARASLGTTGVWAASATSPAASTLGGAAAGGVGSGALGMAMTPEGAKPRSFGLDLSLLSGLSTTASPERQLELALAATPSPAPSPSPAVDLLAGLGPASLASCGLGYYLGAMPSTAAAGAAGFGGGISGGPASPGDALQGPVAYRRPAARAGAGAVAA